MAEYKDLHSSSPARTPKLQLSAEQLLTGECWVSPIKDTPCPGAKEESQQDGRRGEIEFRIKSLTHQRCSEGLKNKQTKPKKTLCSPGSRDLTESEPDLCLSVSCGGVGQKWTATGTGALDTEDLGIV